MHARRVAPGIAVALGLLAMTGIIGCASSSAPNSATAATAASRQPPAPGTSAAVTVSATAAAASGVQNLGVSTAVRGELLTAFAASKSIPAADVAGSRPGSVYYAYDPATGTYWAMASYDPASTDSQAVLVGFQDGGESGLFKRVGSGAWQATQGGEPALCGEVQFFPRTVLEAWSLPTAPTAGMSC
jgi:hypothetical protein